MQLTDSMPYCLLAAGVTLAVAIALHRPYELVGFDRTFRRIQLQASGKARKLESDPDA